MAKAIFNVGDVIEWNRGMMITIKQMELGNKQGWNQKFSFYMNNVIRYFEITQGKKKAAEYFNNVNSGIITNIEGIGSDKSITILDFIDGLEITMRYSKVTDIVKVICKK
jgi:hypothetical protein